MNKCFVNGDTNFQQLSNQMIVVLRTQQKSTFCFPHFASNSLKYKLIDKIKKKKERKK